MYRAIVILTVAVLASFVAAQVEHERWEYGVLVYGDTVSWSSPAGTVQNANEAVFIREFGDFLGARRAVSGLPGILNLAGANGWELIAVTDLVFIFKRSRG